MGLFENSKVKKSISVLLATLSIGSFTGCKSENKNENDRFFDDGYDNEYSNGYDNGYENEYENQYDDALENMGVVIDDEVPIESEENKDNSYSNENDAWKKDIVGMTERDRLELVLDEKNWGEREEEMLRSMFDRIDECYDKREFNSPTNKQNYLRNLVNTIESIDTIKIDPNDPILLTNGWGARADYRENMIVLKFPNTSDIRHELAHMERGTFLNESYGVDLGFVLEEGRASYKEGDAMEVTDWIDDYDHDVSMRGDWSVLIEDTSGSYPAFEDIYEDFMRLGVDLEKIRKSEKNVNDFSREIESSLNNMYGDNMGTKYVKNVNSYINFFNKQGNVALERDAEGRTVLEVKAEMEATYEQCMAKGRNNEVDRNYGMER